MYVDEIQMKNIFNESLTHGIKKDKKWSTFLMKPDISIPQPTKFTEAKKEHVMRILFLDYYYYDKRFQDDGYKVVIKKQPRKIFVPPEKKVQFDQNVVSDQFSNNLSEVIALCFFNFHENIIHALSYLAMSAAFLKFGSEQIYIFIAIIVYAYVAPIRPIIILKVS